MKKPKVSVIVSTYNRLALLKEAIESVLNQTYTDYELLISDDHSTDGTQEYCREISAQNSKVKYVRNSTNLGMVGNWNSALNQANGEYCSILMDDDEWHPDFLETTVAVLDTNPKVGFTYVWILPVEISEDGSRIEIISRRSNYKHYLTNKYLSSKTGLEKFILGELKVGLPSAVLFRKDNSYSFTYYGLDPGFWVDYLKNFDYYYINKPFCIRKEHAGIQFSDSKPNKLYYERLIYITNNAYNHLLVNQQTSRKINDQYRKRMSYLFTELDKAN